MDACMWQGVAVRHQSTQTHLPTLLLTLGKVNCHRHGLGVGAKIDHFSGGVRGGVRSKSRLYPPIYFLFFRFMFESCRNHSFLIFGLLVDFGYLQCSFVLVHFSINCFFHLCQSFFHCGDFLVHFPNLFRICHELESKFESLLITWITKHEIKLANICSKNWETTKAKTSKLTSGRRMRSSCRSGKCSTTLLNPSSGKREALWQEIAMFRILQIKGQRWSMFGYPRRQKVGDMGAILFLKGWKP